MLVRILLVFAILAAPPASFAVAIEDADWHEIRSPNFVAYSAANVNETSRFLKLLELTRELLPQLMMIEIDGGSVPTEIVFLNSKSQMRLLGVDPVVGGEFIEGLRKNVVVARDSRRSQIHEKVLYSYAKYLMNNSSAVNAPRWVSEGFAQYLRSMHLVDGGARVRIGSMPKFFGVTNCGWATVARMLEEDSGQCSSGTVRAPMVIRWLLDQENAGPGLQSYLSRLNAGTSGPEAFSDAFNISLDRLNIDVMESRKDVVVHTKAMHVNSLIPDFETTLRVLKRDEVIVLLARTATRTKEYSNARFWLNQLDWSEPRTASELAALGMLNFYEGRLIQAGLDLAQAESLAPQDELILLDTAKLWLRHAYQEESAIKRGSHAREARRYIGKAWKLNDQNPETYALYGRSYLLEDKFEESLDSLEASNRILPSHSGVLLDLLQAYARLDRHDEAKRLVLRLVRMAHTDRKELSYIYAAIGKASDDSQILRKSDNRSLLFVPRKPAVDDKALSFWY